MTKEPIAAAPINRSAPDVQIAAAVQGCNWSAEQAKRNADLFSALMTDMQPLVRSDLKDEIPAGFYDCTNDP